MRRLGVDPGTRRIGLALSESDVQVAYPHKTIEQDDPEQAARLVAEEVRAAGIDEVVMGLPLRIDGTEGEAARLVRHFATLVQEQISIPVVLWDERLSTVAAERSLSESGIRGAKQRKVVDQAAATLLLQNYIDSKRDGTWEEHEQHDLEIRESPTREQGKMSRDRSRRKR